MTDVAQRLLHALAESEGPDTKSVPYAVIIREGPKVVIRDTSGNLAYLSPLEARMYATTLMLAHIDDLYLRRLLSSIRAAEDMPDAW